VISVRSRCASRVSRRAIEHPNDIASTALYLASDESRMVTGRVLPVDCGVTIS
jgi:enoyl-[acyl-carrier-protein] reductase (NADH)